MLVLCVAARLHGLICVWGIYRLIKFYSNAVPGTTPIDTTPNYNLHKYVIPRIPHSKEVDIDAFLSHIIPRSRNKELLASHLFQELACCNPENPLLDDLEHNHSDSPITTWTAFKQAVLFYKVGGGGRGRREAFQQAAVDLLPWCNAVKLTLQSSSDPTLALPFVLELLRHCKLTHHFSLLTVDQCFSFFSKAQRKQLFKFLPSVLPDEDTQEYAARAYKTLRKRRFKRVPTIAEV